MKAVILVSLCLLFAGVALAPTASAVVCTDPLGNPPNGAIRCADNAVDAVFCLLDDETDPDCP